MITCALQDSRELLVNKMKLFKSVAILSPFLLSIAFLGCSNKDYSLAPVSGTVTYNGNPVSKLRISFSPEPVNGNYAVGPYSKGVTDSTGKFTLQTRYDEAGAVIGKHALSLEYSDISETAMADLRASLRDAQDSGSKADFEATKNKIAALAKTLKGRPVLSSCPTTIDIPASGHEDLRLELSELMVE